LTSGAKSKANGKIGGTEAQKQLTQWGQGGEKLPREKKKGGPERVRKHGGTRGGEGLSKPSK